MNSALVPASLCATQALIDAGVLDFAQLDAAQVGEIAGVWEAQAPALFEVTVDTPELPEDFVCEVCGVGPDMFELVEE